MKKNIRKVLCGSSASSKDRVQYTKGQSGKKKHLLILINDLLILINDLLILINDLLILVNDLLILLDDLLILININ